MEEQREGARARKIRGTVATWRNESSGRESEGEGKHARAQGRMGQARMKEGGAKDGMGGAAGIPVTTCTL